MADGTITVGTVNTNDGATVTADIPAPISDSYVGTVNSNVAVITVPEADLVGATNVTVSLTLNDGVNSDTDSVVVDISAPTPFAVLNVPLGESTFEVREYVNSDPLDGSGALVTQITPNQQYRIRALWQDTDGNYAGDSGTIIPMDVDLGSEVFSSRDGVTNYNIYIYTAPTFSASPDTATFTWGKYDDSTITTFQQASVGFPVAQSTTVSPSTLPDLGALKGAPFAEGYGSDTVGGRNEAIQVASNESEFASFWTGSAPGRILLDFSGDIEPVSRLISGGPNKTVYGQTARGEGVQVFKPTSEDRTTIQVDYSETILQHMRLRAGTETSDDSFVRALDINRGNRSINNFLSYHNDYSWGTDQGISVWYDTQNVGFWGDIFAEPLNHNSHGFNFLVGNQCDLVSINRTYFGVGVDRNPQLQMNKDGVKVQIANNVVSGHGRGMLLRCRQAGSTAYFNVENNFFQRGPNSSGTRMEIEIGEENGGLVSVYANENKYLNNGETLSANLSSIKDARFVSYPDTSVSIRSGAFSSARASMPTISLVGISQIDAEVVSQAGATPARRDATTARIMSGYATSAGYVTSEDRRVMASGPTRLDVSRADKTSAAFRSQYNIDDSVNCLTTADGNGQGWTLFDQFMYWLETQA